LTTTVWVVHEGEETEVHVKEFGRIAGNIQIDSCNHCDDVTSPNWQPSTKAAIVSRLSSGGLDKGRVLLARLIQFPSPALIPISAATLHLGDNLVRVLHLGHTRNTMPTLRIMSAQALVSCCRAIARKHGCTRVEVLLHSEAQAKAFCQRLGFKRVARRGQRYEGLRHNDYLVEKALD
jgi:hypothetical protein